MSRSENSSCGATGSGSEETGVGNLGSDQAPRMNELQVRELRHRLKNTMHLLGTLLRRAEREVAHPEAKAKIRDLAGKVAAIGALERLIHESSFDRGVGVLELVRAVADTVAGLGLSKTDCEISGDAFSIKAQAATTLALIINELLTNCVKHAQASNNPVRIRVSLDARGDCLDLEISDDGAAWDRQRELPRDAGTALVRGLVRQLGGSIAIEQTARTQWVVSLPTASLS